MSTGNVPDDVKRNVRAVLLSKIGGVLVSEFKRDYYKLVNNKLFVDRYGFENYKDFVEAIPDCARLEYSDKDMAYRIFGVGDPTTYMSMSAKKAQGNITRDNNRKPLQNMTSNETVESKKLVPNARGLYTVCYRTSQADTTDADEIFQIFSSVGEVGDVNLTAKWIFVRFTTKAGALASLEKLAYLEVRIAEEGKNKTRDRTTSLVPDSGIGDDSLMTNKYVNKEQDSSQKEESGHDKNQKGKHHENKPLEVFVGNINSSTTNEEFDGLISNMNIKTSKIVRRDRTCYAFIDFYNKADAENAIHQLHGLALQGRKMEARFAHPSAPAVQSKEPDPVLPNQNLNNNSKVSWSRTDVNHNQSSFREKPGILGAAPVMSLRNMDSSASSSGSTTNLTERMTELSVCIDHTGKKMVTSTPLHQLKSTKMTLPSYPSRMSSPSKPSPHSQPSHNSLPSPRPFEKGRNLISKALHMDDDMPKLEVTMPMLESSRTVRSISPETEVDDEQAAAIFIANFPRETTARELYSLFYHYNVLEVNIFPVVKCTKAHIWVSSMSMAEKAIEDMNQTMYMGKVLLLDIPRDLPENREKFILRQQAKGNLNTGQRPMNRLDALEVMCHQEKEMGQASETKALSESSRNDYDVMELYCHILGKIHVQHNLVEVGSRIKVMVTSAEEENFFWGQIVNEKENLNALRQLVKDLQNSENHLARTKGLGRCAALYEGEWHRAWILKASLQRTEKLKVFFIDYGNIESLTWNDTCIIGSRFWQLRPMAVPFSIAGDGVPDLGSLESTVVECLVTKTSPVACGFLTEVKFINTQLLGQ